MDKKNPWQPHQLKNDTPSRRELNIFRLSHCAKGHKTDNCKALKSDFEELILNIYLKNMDAKKESSHSFPPHRDQAQPSSSKQRKRTINTISCAFVAGGENIRGWEIYATQLSMGKRPRSAEVEVISFIEGDITQITTSHDDAVVITSIIMRLDAKRILIDVGSLMYILFLDAFTSMGSNMKEFKSA